MFGWIVIEAGDDATIVLHDPHLSASGCDVYISANNLAAIGRFANMQRADLIQASCQRARKIARHVLHHENGNREIGRQFRQQLPERFRSPG